MCYGFPVFSLCHSLLTELQTHGHTNPSSHDIKHTLGTVFAHCTQVEQDWNKYLHQKQCLSLEILHLLHPIASFK